MPRTPLSVAAVFATLASAPTAQVTVTLNASKDNSLFAELHNSSNGSGPRLFTGVTLRRLLRRAMVAFDTSAIPSCATITSVQVFLTVQRTQSTPKPVDLHLMLADWGEGPSNSGFGKTLGLGGGAGAPALAPDATWINRRHPSTPWFSFGGDYSPTVSASTVARGFGTHTWGSTAQLVADVQSWVDDPTSNFGWMILTDESVIPSARVFVSREGRPRSDRPSLQVTYTTASVVPSGTGCTGSGATPYTLAANGLPTVPNPSFALLFSGGPATTAEAAVLTLNLLQPPLPFGVPGCTLLVDPIPLQVVVLAAGGSAALPIPALPESMCFPLAVQGVGIDAARNDLVTSNALTLTFGQ